MPQLQAKHKTPGKCYLCGDESHTAFSRGTLMWDRLTGAPPYPDEIELCADCYAEQREAINAGVW